MSAECRGRGLRQHCEPRPELQRPMQVEGPYWSSSDNSRTSWFWEQNHPRMPFPRSTPSSPPQPWRLNPSESRACPKGLPEYRTDCKPGKVKYGNLSPSREGRVAKPAKTASASHARDH